MQVTLPLNVPIGGMTETQDPFSQYPDSTHNQLIHQQHIHCLPDTARKLIPDALGMATQVPFNQYPPTPRLYDAAYTDGKIVNVAGLLVTVPECWLLF